MYLSLILVHSFQHSNVAEYLNSAAFSSELAFIIIHFVQLKQQEKQQHFDCDYNYNFFDFSRLKQSFMPLDYETHY